MRSLTITISLTAAASLLLLCACSQEDRSPRTKPAAPPTPREVRIVQPFRDLIVRSVTLPGQVKPYREATLYAKVTGYLKSVSVDTGDEVTEGQPLAEIEVPELIADAAKYQAEVKLADLEFQRVSEARKKAPDLVVPLSVDTAQSRAAVAKANLERASTLLAFTRINAPFEGIVTKRMVDPGAFVPAATSGSPQNAALLTLADFKKVRVQVAVPEAEASRVRKGQPVTFVVDGLPGRSFNGEVTRFAYALDELTKTMIAEVELPNPQLELRPGMYVTAQIGLERKENALLVPAAAVLSEKANRFVFTLAEGKARKTQVTAGFSNRLNVEILNGLQEGNAVLIPVKGVLADGENVKIER